MSYKPESHAPAPVALDHRTIAVVRGLSRIPALTLTYASEVTWGAGFDREKSQPASEQAAAVAIRVISGRATFLFATSGDPLRVEVEGPAVIFFNHRDLRRQTIHGDRMHARWCQFYAAADIEHWFHRPIPAPASRSEDDRFAEIQHHLQSERGNDHAYAAAVFSQLVYSWLRDSDIDCRDANERLVSETMALFRDHVLEGISVENAANQVGVHPASLRRLFRLLLKMSPKQYLMRLQYEEARRLLQDGHPAKKVSKLLGFEDQSQFSRFFKRRAGLTVREYQKRNGPKRR